MSEVLGGLHTIADEITITSLPTDQAEKDLVSSFMANDCGYTKKCSKQFSIEYMVSVRESCAELTHGELDMGILGQLMASTNTSTSVSTIARHREADRQRASTSYIKARQCVLKCSGFSMALALRGLKELKGEWVKS